MDAHDAAASSGMSFDWKSEEGGNPAKSFQLLARLVVAAHQDDGSPSGLRGPHEILDSGIPHDGIAHEEGLDRAGLDRFRNFGGSVRARPIRRNRLQQLLDEPRLVPDPAVSEDLCANTRFERLLNSLHPGLSRAVRMDFRNEGWLPRFQVLQERVPCEPRSDEDERFADFRGEKRFFVVQGKEGDEGPLCRSNGFLDPPQLMRLPRLDDGEDVIDRDVQRVMPPEVLRSLDDDAGDA